MKSIAWANSGVKIRPFRYGNITDFDRDYLEGEVVKIRPFRYGNFLYFFRGITGGAGLKSDRFGMEINVTKCSYRS